MSTPADLKQRGREIWAAFNASSLPAGNRALVHEACRLADTLDKLDAILSQRADEWARIVVDDMGDVTLVVDSLLGERRQQALALKQLMGEIRTAGLKQTGGRPVEQEPEGRGGLIIDITSRLG